MAPPIKIKNKKQFDPNNNLSSSLRPCPPQSHRSSPLLHLSQQFSWLQLDLINTRNCFISASNLFLCVHIPSPLCMYVSERKFPSLIRTSDILAIGPTLIQHDLILN